jgi:hypothetical protein
MPNILIGQFGIGTLIDGSSLLVLPKNCQNARPPRLIWATAPDFTEYMVEQLQNLGLGQRLEHTGIFQERMRFIFEAPDGWTATEPVPEEKLDPRVPVTTFDVLNEQGQSVLRLTINRKDATKGNFAFIDSEGKYIHLK